MHPDPSPPPDHPYRFAPVPRHSDRPDGWTSDRQHAFVWALARLPSVTAAARSVGMSPRSAYRLRAAPGAEAFAKAWDDAVRIGIEATIDTAFDRAVNGQEYPMHHRGRVVGKVHRYDNRLMIHLLQHLDHARQPRRDRARTAPRPSNKVSRPRNLGPAPAMTIASFGGPTAPDVESPGRAS